MKIVILDGYTTDEGQLSWGELEKLGELVYYERTPIDKVVERAKSADILIANKVILSKEVLSQLDNLKYIGLLSTGYNVVDLDYAKQRGIPVCNIPNYSTKSVAQLTVALLLEIAMGVGKHSISVSRGDWAKCNDFCYTTQSIAELDGKTIGLVGYGAIAKEVAKIAKAFGMKALAYRRTPCNNDDIAQMVSLDELYRQSDVISMHCPMNGDSDKMIDEVAIGKMKDGVIILNTARGGIVDEKAIRSGLESGKIAGYGADVLSTEPPQKDNALIDAPNCYITPHIAWASKEAKSRLMSIAIDNVKSFLNGKIKNCVYKQEV
ncbi:MAG: D-2-hydroxyacid dehydrogenase [Clostridia bacterium]|nr:D-2-hydroxyacid dehydrogenase [Clostridia bacterium]